MIYIMCPLIFDLLKYGRIDEKPMLHNITLMVQPLKSLMWDQKKQLESLGLAVIYVGEEEEALVGK